MNPTASADTPPDDTAPPVLQRWQAWQRLSADLGDLLEGRLALPATFTAGVQSLARRMDGLMQEDDDLGVFEVIRMDPEKLGRYGTLHSLHTAIVVWLVATRKEWSEPRRQSALCAALTMNIAVTHLQTQLALQTGPMSPEQQRAMKQHPLDSMEMLRTLGVNDPEWLNAVAQHHEQPDGKGYPLGLEKLGEMADVLRTCDVFCAKMSPRAGRGALLSPSAAQAIFRQRSAGYFGATVVSTVGVFPPGCLVGLGSGEAAIVLRRTRDAHRPEVAVLTDASGMPLDQPLRSATGKTIGRPVMQARPDPSLGHLFSPERLLAAP